MSDAKTPTWKEVLLDPLIANNPVMVQVLGICSSLAVTSSMKTAFVMGISVTCVCALANLAVSCTRNYIPSSVRIIAQMTIIASLVILVDQVLKAFAYDLSKQLSVYVGLIITNCIVMGRTEGFALKYPPMTSMVDGIGNGLGYMLVLCIIATVREVFGSGSWFGITLFETVNNGGWYVPCGLLIMPPCGFFLVGLLIWVVKTFRKDLVEQPEYETHREG
ncbi:MULTISPECIES: NADH:ubiquinone reductase (Na(+)-transporting) subunit D [unclassified Anaerobiospirillum]|uniref:NADH:ubiquinone reductase (Na(+)-transporting) subunit D n=1 Tax=unclassified Anaerobiospirillum TaxID=2647410 RepID=UPI001FF5F32A|nr:MULTISPECIES: NADH:ubiquinone reductase (Na(+)-transporting) subunit D [unclassified Anaerobiospirillum]MCK0525773.1 NADH:ubiquinone reductase (Na(+)-transporting) subunit D [Anaerobiospirillum sp. NML120449]MCK0534930.1 NADH:ubiquinone reductase (Na(+)-transporting) subunit D [Anaerobiospirillum sp. NML120511]MCK0540371.1 NADH:ubiquinone reductase (Na(+)-transporting) subunit D [Anaerobiospirillum sp. NML02-A-032]